MPPVAGLARPPANRAPTRGRRSTAPRHGRGRGRWARTTRRPRGPTASRALPCAWRRAGQAGSARPGKVTAPCSSMSVSARRSAPRPRAAPGHVDCGGDHHRFPRYTALTSWWPSRRRARRAGACRARPCARAHAARGHHGLRAPLAHVRRGLLTQVGHHVCMWTSADGEAWRHVHAVHEHHARRRATADGILHEQVPAKSRRGLRGVAHARPGRRGRAHVMGGVRDANVMAESRHAPWPSRPAACKAWRSCNTSARHAPRTHCEISAQRRRAARVLPSATVLPAHRAQLHVHGDAFKRGLQDGHPLLVHLVSSAAGPVRCTTAS